MFGQPVNTCLAAGEGRRGFARGGARGPNSRPSADGLWRLAKWLEAWSTASASYGICVLGLSISSPWTAEANKRERIWPRHKSASGGSAVEGCSCRRPGGRARTLPACLTSTCSGLPFILAPLFQDCVLWLAGAARGRQPSFAGLSLLLIAHIPTHYSNHAVRGSHQRSAGPRRPGGRSSRRPAPAGAAPGTSDTRIACIAAVRPPAAQPWVPSASRCPARRWRCGPPRWLACAWSSMVSLPRPSGAQRSSWRRPRARRSSWTPWRGELLPDGCQFECRGRCGAICAQRAAAGRGRPLAAALAWPPLLWTAAPGFDH